MQMKYPSGTCLTNINTITKYSMGFLNFQCRGRFAKRGKNCHWWVEINSKHGEQDAGADNSGHHTGGAVAWDEAHAAKKRRQGF
ncbi:MAG: hypothetical protein Kow0027_22540 [Saprospiraceae bacterium]